MPLNPSRIFIVDNFSTDGTYEILNSIAGVEVTRKRCTHGRGRQLALEKVLKVSGDEDFVMYIDLDTVYKDKYISLIKDTVANLKDAEVLIFGMLSKAKLNRTVEWRNLFTSEDLERHAHFKHEGYKIIGTQEQFMIQYGGKGLYNQYYENDIATGDNFYARHLRYKTSRLKFFVRMFRVLIDDERGVAFKSFQDFYKQSSKKSVSMRVVYYIAYVIAKILGVYEYNADLNNLEYVMASSP